MKRFFIPPLLVALFFVGACESEAPITAPENIPDSVAASVDASASPSEFQLGQSTSLHADVRHLAGPYQTEWRVVETGELVGWGDDVTYTPKELGQPWLACLIWQEEVVVLADSTRLTVTPPDELEPLVIDNVSASPQAGMVGTETVLDVDTQGGEGILDYVWRTNDGTIVGTNESIYYTFSRVGPDTVTVWVIDEVFQSDQMSVILTGLPGDDDPEDPETIDWVVPTNLVTRSNHRQDTEVVAIGHQGQFHLWAKLRFDISPRKDVRIWFTYADGSVRHFPVIPDVIEQRPAIVMVDLGYGLVEENQEVTLYLTVDPSKAAAGGGDSNKSSGTVKLLELQGSTDLPMSSYDQLITLDQQPALHNILD